MEQVRFCYSDNKIQSFLAVFSFCEKHQNTHEFFYDDKTYFFLKRIHNINYNNISKLSQAPYPIYLL